METGIEGLAQRIKKQTLQNNISRRKYIHYQDHLTIRIYT